MTQKDIIRPSEIVLEDHWAPLTVGQFNNQLIKTAKVLGELHWHKHDEEDKVFLVVSGSLRIEYEDRAVTLEAGDLHIVPRGALHKPAADAECRIIWIEPT